VALALASVLASTLNFGSFNLLVILANEWVDVSSVDISSVDISLIYWESIYRRSIYWGSIYRRSIYCGRPRKLERLHLPLNYSFPAKVQTHSQPQEEDGGRIENSRKSENFKLALHTLSEHLDG
jgi:hypothetical protein